VDIALEPGWRRWLLFTLLAILLAALAGLTLDRIDPRTDPSALVSRSSRLYLETRDAKTFFARAGAWPGWSRERLTESRDIDDDKWNRLQIDLAGLAGAAIPSLGVRTPLRWLAESTRLALALSEDDGTPGWTLLFDIPEPRECLAELGVEPGLRLERIGDASGGGQLFRLSGNAGGNLHLAAAGPWLIVAPAQKAAQFALDSWGSPAFSLANSGLVPVWRRGAVLRGALDPSYLTESARGGAWLDALGGWLDADARLGFTARFDEAGIGDAEFEIRKFSAAPPGGGLWPLVRIVLALLGIACLLLILLIILAAVGFGARLKILAIRAGLSSAPKPVQVELSTAFMEDAGLAPGKNAEERATDAAKPE
jgi:hypothetical protein